MKKEEKKKISINKKITGFIARNTIGFIIGAIVFGTIGVYAATIIAGSQVSYSNASTGLSSTNVQGAIDELYKMAENHCPKGYVCKLPLCIRAETLHTETCSQTSTTGYCSADGYTASGTKGTTTITYGNLGTSGLTTGDAFDCDVNGDGTYDSETERFYYVTDLEENSDYAVLVYYNNVSGGEPNNMTKYEYNTTYSSSEYYGPQTAIAQLPTTSQWKNVSLTNIVRDIKDEKGTVRVEGFSYEGYAARLLTYEEVNRGCYDGTTAINTKGGISNKCRFLMENTKYSRSSLKTYGVWLESPYSRRANLAWNVCDDIHNVGNFLVDDASFNGVRPVIEVLKSNISL